MSNTKKDKEYQELFLAEAIENVSEINRFLTQLEKDVDNEKIIQALFRITHTLKGNATGMGYEKIAELSHVMEDFFGEVQRGKIKLGEEIFATVFKAADALEKLIDAIKDPKEVKYRGIKTKLEVLVKNSTQTTPNEKKSTRKSDAVTSQTSSPEEQDSESDDEAVEEENETGSISFSDLIQVSVKKLDNLLNLVGELVIERDRIVGNGLQNHSKNEFARLNRISSDLQYSVMDVRLVQVGFLFNKFHRIVRDAAAREGKKVDLQLSGTETEIDRNILQVMSDSLIHVIRNAVSHGIENADTRKKTGKPEEGTITLSAESESDTVIITIKDDGAGIDPAKIRKKAIERELITEAEAKLISDQDLIALIFNPGFTTVDNVTAMSGRGVGMDVVKKAIDSIGGTVKVDSMIGEGTIITLTLPASMAVKSTLLFELESQTYAIPLSYTESVISIYKGDIHSVSNGLVTIYQGNTIQIVFLSDLFAGYLVKAGNHSSYNERHPEQKLDVVVVAINGKRMGFVVDKLLQQKEIVEKPLKKPFEKAPFLSGVTILGNGNVCLVLSIPGLLNILAAEQKKTYNI